VATRAAMTRNRCGTAMMIIMIVLTLFLGLPLLILVEILLLMFCGIRWLPPLSCMLNTSPLTGTFDRTQIPPHPKVPESLLSKCEVVDIRGIKWLRAIGTVADQVDTMCKIMLAYNTVSTTLENPEDLQGVFWMDGNRIPEELCCLSYASSSEKDGRYLLSKVNGVQSWTYLDSPFGKFIAWFQEGGETSGMQVFSFEGRQAQEGRIWSCTTFDYEDINWLTSLGEWTMERLPGPGVTFKRGCYWFNRVFGRCAEFGSYNLRKIMHSDGSPVEPAYGEFVKYMETTNKGLSLLMETEPTAEVGSGSPDAPAATPN